MDNSKKDNKEERLFFSFLFCSLFLFFCISAKTFLVNVKAFLSFSRSTVKKTRANVDNLSKKADKKKRKDIEFISIKELKKILNVEPGKEEEKKEARLSLKRAMTTSEFQNIINFLLFL